MKRIASLALTLIVTVHNAYADVNEELGKIWESLGGESVTNGASYYQGQKRGHYTMGSMYFARKKVNRPLISVNFPEIDLDKSCYNQGVLNFGGLSFISADELKNKLESIAQQGGMMVAYMGLSAISPVISETLQEVYSKLQELGGMLADECQVSKQIVTAMGDHLSEHSEMAKSIFARFKPGRGENDDLSKAYSEFPRGKNAVLQDAATKDESLMLEDINIAWKAMDKLNINDKELRKLMMSISGTVIIKAPQGDNGRPAFQYISSQVTNSSMLEALLKGNRNMKLLKCSDTAKCLSVSDEEKMIHQEDSFEYKVTQYFEKFRIALKEDEELEKGAKTFLAKSGLPAFIMYDKLYQYTGGNPEYEQGILVEIVAWNILYNYLGDILREVTEATNNLQLAASSDLKEFKASLKAASQTLNDHEMKDMSRYKLQQILVQRFEAMQESMAADVASYFSLMRM